MQTTRQLALGFLIGLLYLTSSAPSAAGEFKQGQTYFGFKLLEMKQIPEISCLGLLFEHQRSGARLLKLKNDDDNKSFMITFITPPPDDSGLPHILEHSVLAGSRKFPVKDPFMTLRKGSLSTFLNAMTASDHTMYPVASRNTNEFFNLMDVYLDAVFYPKIYDNPLTFLQEGWRFELANKDAELTYNGVVYNEMKGAYSSPFSVLYRTVSKGLFPNNEYSNDSGGYPPAIPNLTRKAFLAFHKRYYHPSNAFINLYGNGDTLAELKFIDANYLAGFKRSIRATIAKHKTTTAMKQVSAQYSVAASETIVDKTYLALAFVVGGPQDPGLSMALDVLADALVNQRSAPIRTALEEAGIGKDVFAFYDDTQQGVFIIGTKNANRQDKDRFKSTVFNTLRQVAQNGLNKKDIQGVLNRKEFSLREADYGGFSKGLVYAFMSLGAWMFADDPFRSLFFENNLAYVRRAMTTNQLEGLVKAQLLENPYSLFAVIEPKPGLNDEIEEKRKAALAKTKANMKPAQIQKLVAQTQRLKEYQKSPDKPEDVAKIPMLSRADLDPQAPKLGLDKNRIGDVLVLHHKDQTNGIIYLELLFDVSVVPEEMIPYVPVLTSVLGELDTRKHSYQELTTQLNIDTGGLYFYEQTFVDEKKDDAYYPKLVANAKVLTPKFDKLIDLSQEIVAQTRFSDKNRLKNVLAKINARAEDLARNAGRSLAVTRLHSYLSKQGYYEELTKGLRQIHFIKDLSKRFDKNSNDIIADLQFMASLIFNRKNLIVGVTCSDKDYKQVKKHLPTLLAGLGTKEPKVQHYVFAHPDNKNEALLAASKVNYVIEGANFSKLGHRYSGKLKVLEQILSKEFLHSQIREQGGAYGAWASFSRTGTGYLASYRDPNLGRTLNVYNQTASFLKSFSPTEREMTRFIIGVIGAEDQPMTPSVKGSVAIARYLQGWTYQDQQKERSEILTTTPADITAMSQLLDDMVKQNTICVYGNEKQLKKKKAMFGDLIKVID